jgi:hypothetical protein
MSADGNLPIVCQATGQLTCTSLADTGENGAFPNNTSTVFSNIFDSSSDFSTVQYLGLSGIMLTTPPPVPPTLISIAAEFDGGINSIQADSLLTLYAIQLFSNGNSGAIEGATDAERLVLNLTYDATATPQIGIGTILRGPNDYIELQRLVQSTMAGAKLVPTISVDSSSILSNITIGAPTAVMYEESLFSGYTTTPTSGLAFEASERPPVSELVIIPSTTFTVANVSAQLDGFNYSDTWRVLHAGTPWAYSPSTLEFNLIGTLSDSTTIPLGTYSLIPNLENWIGLPANFGDLPPNNNQIWRWPIGGPVVGSNTPVTPFSPGREMTWNTNGSFVRVRFPASGAYLDTYTQSSMAVDNGAEVLPWYTFTTNLIGAPTYTLPSAISNPLFIQRRLFVGGPYKSHATRKTIVKHDRTNINKSVSRAIDALDKNEKKTGAVFALYAAPIATYDNLLQILSNELETDRLAGSNSAQILALVPINPADLLTNGFLYIPIPVNDFVWRKLSDIHIKSITFELYNGAGSPPSYLEDNAFVVTLQMRYK